VKLLGASMGDASTLVGFLHIELFSMILPAAIAAFAAGVASGFTAGEESAARSTSFCRTRFRVAASSWRSGSRSRWGAS